MLRAACFALLVSSTAGCGEKKEPGPGDAGPESGPDGGRYEPVRPVPPEPPRMSPCPSGWREVADPESPDIVTCDPWPEGGPDDCAIDEAHFPGGLGCERIGTECPEGDWPEGLPDEGTILYVKPDAVPDGDGTMDRPFATLREAVAVAEAGTIIALSKGTHEAGINILTHPVLWGACVAQTIVTNPVEDGYEPALTLFGWGADVRNLQVTGPNAGIDVSGLGDMLIDSVLIYRAKGTALRSTADLTVRDLVVIDTQPAEDAWGARGLAVDENRTEIDRAVFQGNVGIGISVQNDGSQLIARDVAVRDTRPLGSGEGGSSESTRRTSSSNGS